MATMSKFEQLHESAFARYTQGNGFLAGDVVKFKKNTVKSDWFKSKGEKTQALIRELMDTTHNLRIGVLKNEFPRSIGAYGANDVPAEMADIYVELSPGNWAYPMTVPLSYLEVIQPTDNTIGGPVPDVIKDRERTQIKGEAKKKGGASTKQTKVDDSQRQLPTNNTKIPGGKKWNDSKPGAGNMKPFKESTTLEDMYTCVIQEEKEPGSGQKLLESLTSESEYDTCETEHDGNDVIVTFKDSVYSSVVDDEIPVVVKAVLTVAADDTAAGYIVNDIMVTDERGREVKLTPKDTDYLTSRAIDFAGQSPKKESLTEERGDKNVKVGNHEVIVNKRITGGSDPTVMMTYKFDDGHSVVEFFGDYELKDAKGKRLAYVSKSSELNKHLHRLGLPLIDDIDAAIENMAASQEQEPYVPDWDASP